MTNLGTNSGLFAMHNSFSDIFSEIQSCVFIFYVGLYSLHALVMEYYMMSNPKAFHRIYGMVILNGATAYHT